MEASAVAIPRLTDRERARAEPRPVAVPWHLHAVVFASARVVLGVLWDISWHETIGRDTFWTPAHVAEYLGGIVAGLACGWRVLRTSFGGSDAERGAARAASVRFWHFFYGPLGAWVCIWGAFAMLTSAPFDNWWHNAYGLDVKILSPPHAVLATGIGAIGLGAVLMAAPFQLVDDERAAARYRWAYALASGLFLLMMTIMITEYTMRIYMHTSLFYRVVCLIVPVVLVMLARGSRLRWPATTIALAYTALELFMTWFLPLWAAEPKLGPIYQPLTHMMAAPFPLLLAAPAVAIDLVLRRVRGGRWRDWLLAALLGAVFLAVFLPVQWSFADVLMHRAWSGWLLGNDRLPYFVSSDTHMGRFEYLRLDHSAAALRNGLLAALGIAMVSARVGLWAGNGIATVRR